MLEALCLTQLDQVFMEKKPAEYFLYREVLDRVVIVPCRTVPTPKHGPVVSCLSLSQHGTIGASCLISARHGTERCVLLEISTRHEAGARAQKAGHDMKNPSNFQARHALVSWRKAPPVVSGPLPGLSEPPP
jgi:hypothetical protein